MLSFLQSPSSWRQQLVHDHLKQGQVSSPSCNITLLKRKVSSDKLDSSMARLLVEEPTLHARATIRPSSDHSSLCIVQVEDSLLTQCKGLRQHLGARWADESISFLAADIASAIEVYLEARGPTSPTSTSPPPVNVKLEVVDGVRCPKWHADTVGLRLLITYIGQGTCFVENRHVRRTWEGQGQGIFSSVRVVDETQASQADTGDILILKGHSWQPQGSPSQEKHLLDGLVTWILRGSFTGLGAVHKSPESDEGERRLLLTIDDVVGEEDECECGSSHS